MKKLARTLHVISATLFSATTFAATTFYWVDNAGKAIRDGGDLPQRNRLVAE